MKFLKLYIWVKVSMLKRWIHNVKFKLKLHIKYFGRKNYSMSEELKVFYILILKMKNDFVVKNKGVYPDVIILRNKAAGLYLKFKESQKNNRSYLERFMDVNPKSFIDTVSQVIALREPCIRKPDIEMIRYGTSIRRVHEEPENENRMGTVRLDLINGCDEDQIVTENLL